jgi:hypothetical protein
MLPIEEGREPVRELEYRLTKVRLLILSIEEGREPVRELTSRLRKARLLMLPMEEGREPVRELAYIKSVVRLLILPIEEGRVPVILLVLTSIEVTTPLVQLIPVHEHLFALTVAQSHPDPILDATSVEEIKSHRTPSSTLP